VQTKFSLLEGKAAHDVIKNGYFMSLINPNYVTVIFLRGKSKIDPSLLPAIKLKA